MSKTVGLRDELYERLERQARMQNITVEQIIENLTQEVESAHLAAALDRMKTEVIIVTFDAIDTPTPVNFQPITVQGKPVSEIIIEERGEVV